MATLLYRIGGFAARRHFVVIGIWVLLIAAALLGSKVFDGQMAQSVEIPGTQSQTAIDMLQSRFPAASGASAKVIFVAPEGGDIHANQAQIESAVKALTALDDVAAVSDPFVAANSAQIAANNSMAYVAVQYSVPQSELTQEQENAVRAIGQAEATDGVTVAFSGLVPVPAAADNSQEAVGLLVAFIILAITIGSLLAAGMPLVTAGIGVVISTSAITIFAKFVTISSTAPVLASMLGLAVGIDYALFIVSRHRSQLAAGVKPRESIALAISTAGSAVVFAALTVIIALIGLSVVQIPFLSVMGIGAAVGVLLALVVSVTLLPAILSLFGRRLIPKPGSRAFKREAATHDTAGAKPTLGRRWVTLVTKKPLITLISTALLLLVVAVPALGMKLTIPDAGYDPEGSEARVAYDLLTEGYGPGFNGPLLVTADISKTTDVLGALKALETEFTGLADVAAVSQAGPNAAFDMAVISITPSSSPDSDATKNLVNTLRAGAPAFEKANGFTYMVTGQTAVSIDISNRLGDALGPFALVVVGLCLVLLTMVFRSIAVPITATLGFLLSVSASLGIITAIFNWGWLAGPIGVQKVGPVISFMPILVMAVLFGLAMDYQVFLVSRMREEYTKTGRAFTSVVDGFSASARVVTAAALIMFSVFASFVPGGGAVLQPLAGALAIGVLIDAFLVRMTLIPAVMALLGDKAWYLPKWLQRIVPDVDLEGEKVHALLAARNWRPEPEVAAGPATAVRADASASPAATDTAASDTAANPEGGALALAETTAAATGSVAISAEGAPTPGEAGLPAAAGSEVDARPGTAPALEASAPEPGSVLSIAAGALLLDGVEPFDLRVGAGDILIVGGTRHDSVALLAAVTGRHTAGGFLTVLGHAQPFEASALRREAVLVLATELDDSTLTLAEYLSTQVALVAKRLHRAHRRAKAVSLLGQLEAVHPEQFTEVSAHTPIGQLSTYARTAVDVAVGLAAERPLLAIDLTTLGHPLALDLIESVNTLAPASTTLVFAVSPFVDGDALSLDDVGYGNALIAREIDPEVFAPSAFGLELASRTIMRLELHPSARKVLA
ncbi:MMPL family transporter [Subtercola sp. PAMC28395]|uniref:MMPL family transporter n=1 Tax=Subtercola sp. PAMC28395 TaxID=2846775 RepID=UPI001C0C62DB|nr:MMPL family transporter [Subtercola sp. PAMC28395]QWT24505.1 MMPL family transporter [Subtercola sp. PAMC28395]